MMRAMTTTCVHSTPRQARIAHALAAPGLGLQPAQREALGARTLAALAGAPGADGLPDLSFLTRRQQAAVLAVVYAEHIAQQVAA